MVDRLNKIVILFLCPLIVSARSLITNETICGMLPLHNGSMTALSHQEKVAYCKHFKPYVVNSVTKPDMCVAREDSMLKNGRSIIGIIETRGYLPTCRVMQLLLWMMATVTGGVLRSKLFIDVGSNIGSCSVCMSSLGLHSIAIEPYLPHVDIIHASKRLNSHSMHIIHGGAGEVSTSQNVVFEHGGQNFGATRIDQVTTPGRLRKRKLGEQYVISKVESGKLDIVALFDIIPNDKEVSMLKLDCEGCEWKALLGLGNKLKQVAMIKMEVGNKYFPGPNNTATPYSNVLHYLHDNDFVLFKDIYPDTAYYFGKRKGFLDPIDELFGALHAPQDNGVDIDVLRRSAVSILKAEIKESSFTQMWKRRELLDVIAIRRDIYLQMNAFFVKT